MRVVVVGGGFGGVRAALNLANKHPFEVKLISVNSYFEYHAALYRSATGRSPLEVAIPLADFFRHAANVEVINDEVVDIDNNAKQITGKSGAHYQYDKAILAVGSVTQYFGISGLKEYSYGVKTIHEALELKRHLHEDLTTGASNLRHYVVVGAGATGVELAAEMAAYLKKVRRRHGLSNKFTIDLIEAAPHTLPALPERFSGPILKRLHKLGVRVHLNTAIKAETIEGIKLPHGEIKAHTAVWTAGVANNPLFKKTGPTFRLNERGKAVVNDYLEAAENIYVIGDSASTTFSGMAQTALHDANFVSADLSKQIKNQLRQVYKPKRPIYAVPVGTRWAAVLWGKTRIYGIAGWVLRRLADLRLYLTFLPFAKALTTWRYGFVLEETCPVCLHRFPFSKKHRN